MKTTGECRDICMYLQVPTRLPPYSCQCKIFAIVKMILLFFELSGIQCGSCTLRNGVIFFSPVLNHIN